MHKPRQVEVRELLREIGLPTDHSHCRAHRTTVVRRLVKHVGVTAQVARKAIKEAVDLHILTTEDHGRILRLA